MNELRLNPQLEVKPKRRLQSRRCLPSDFTERKSANKPRRKWFVMNVVCVGRRFHSSESIFVDLLFKKQRWKFITVFNTSLFVPQQQMETRVHTVSHVELQTRFINVGRWELQLPVPLLFFSTVFHGSEHD